jgi:hypothetical protein
MLNRMHKTGPCVLGWAHRGLPALGPAEMPCTSELVMGTVC